MSYFTDEFLQFFAELSHHNERGWFHTNKDRYEHFVKKPFIRLMDDLIQEITTFDDHINCTVKDAVFRINRDVRFSKNKQPYTTDIRAGIARDGRRSGYPGYFIRLNHSGVGIGGGQYAINAELMRHYHGYLVSHMDELIEIERHPVLLETFGSFAGERLKRTPAIFKDVHPISDLVHHKRLFVWEEFGTELVTSDALFDITMDRYRKIRVLNQLFYNAMR